jgi:hypothetical protein
MSIQFCELDQQVDRELLVSREEARGVKDERSLLVGVVESRPHSTPSHSQTSGQVGGAWETRNFIPGGPPSTGWSEGVAYWCSLVSAF